MKNIYQNSTRNKQIFNGISKGVFINKYKGMKNILKTKSNNLSQTSYENGKGCKVKNASKKQEERDELGRSTWHLLHVMASKYPLVPTTKEKKNYMTFLNLLSVLFPCEECSGHFQNLLKMHPPVLDSRDKFEEWLCNAHNIVNIRLNKPIFNCKRLSDVWGCGCEI